MTTPADQLIQLASQQFGQLNSSEEKLLTASATGEIAECATSQDKARDPKNYQVWGQERTIRASILQWLCSRTEARDFVSAAGIKVALARFVGELNLAGISVGFSVSLFDCALPDGLNLRDFTVRYLNLTGSMCGYLTADRLTVNGSLFMRGGFTATGQVILIGASISGDLDCAEGHFGSPAGQQKGAGPDVAPHLVLMLNRVSVGGGAFLGPKFVAHGVVNLADATIKGSLDCTQSVITFGINMRDLQTRTINFSGTNCPYLVADRINAKGSVLLREGFRAEGGVVLFNSSITGDLDCNGGFFGHQLPDSDSSKKANEIFRGLPSTAIALNGSSIGGYVYLGYGFEANGQVWCNGVNIGANLHCDGGSFLAPGDAMGTFYCQFTQIRGAALFRKDTTDRPFQCAGFVNLFGTNVAGSMSFEGANFFGPAPNGLKMQSAAVAGNFRWKNVSVSENTELHLSHSRVGQFEDDDTSWPRQEKLKLDGFSYNALESVPLDTKRRKSWLSSHLNYLRRQAKDDFSLQPFRQFADVLRRSGYEDNAKDVLIDMHKAKREHGGLGVWGRSWSQILQRSIGFGYRSHWAFGWTLLFVLFGAVLFNYGYRSGLIVPAKPPATSSFSAVGYSLDTFLPIVNLHQEELWTATDGEGRSSWLQYYYWLHIALGWALVTLGVAGFTGLIRKE